MPGRTMLARRAGSAPWPGPGRGPATPPAGPPGWLGLPGRRWESRGGGGRGAGGGGGGGPRGSSRRDIEKLAEICALTADGLNLAGIRRVLELQEETRQLQAELARLRELAGTRLGPAERSRKQRTRQAAGE